MHAGIERQWNQPRTSSCSQNRQCSRILEGLGSLASLSQRSRRPYDPVLTPFRFRRVDLCGRLACWPCWPPKDPTKLQLNTVEVTVLTPFRRVGVLCGSLVDHLCGAPRLLMLHVQHSSMPISVHGCRLYRCQRQEGPTAAPPAFASLLAHLSSYLAIDRALSTSILVQKRHSMNVAKNLKGSIICINLFNRI